MTADIFRYERSILIAAPAAAVFRHVNDFHLWGAWNPFERMDTVIEKTFEGPASGKGAAYGWSGKKAGVGRMEILTSDVPSKILIKLDFSKPMAAHNTAEFTFEPQGANTKVTWAMYGPKTLMSKVMGLVMNFDKMVGGEFEKGLASLKQISEGATAPA